MFWEVFSILGLQCFSEEGFYLTFVLGFLTNVYLYQHLSNIKKTTVFNHEPSQLYWLSSKLYTLSIRDCIMGLYISFYIPDINNFWKIVQGPQHFKF